MKEIIVKILNNGKVYLINNILGYDGEHISKNLKIIMDSFVDGIGILEVEQNGEKNHLTMDKVGESYVLPIYSSLLTGDKLNMQLVIMVEDNIVYKSEIFTFNIGKSIGATEREFLEEYSGYITQINEKLNLIQNLADDLEEKVASGYFKGEQGVQGKDGKVVLSELTEEERESLRGLAGTNGENGATFTPNVDTNGNLSWTNDKGLTNPTTVNLKVGVPTKTSELQNDSGFITGYTEIDPTVPSHVKGITQENITSWNNKSNFSGSYNDLTDKPTMPTVPTNISEFTNDVGYPTTEEMNTAIENAINTSITNVLGGSI